jgi:SAM-dependent methyltransferase
MSLANTTMFYRSWYRSSDIENDRPIDWVVEKEQERARYQIDFIAEWMNAPHRFLDIGASSGQLLRAARDRFGCRAIGIEPGDVYRSEAEKAFPFYSSVESLIESNEPRFDVVAMSHVLEHLHQPVSFLSNLREHVLQNEGALFIEVPNLYGHSCFEPAHLYSFSEQTLSALLRASGFRITHCKLHSAPRQFGWRNITVLARPIQVRPVSRRFFVPSWVKFQRTVGLSGTRHWYGYLYRQARNRLFKKIS